MTVSASDEDGDDLTYAISVDDGDKFSQSGDTFTWTPPYDDYSSNNTFNITIEVSDGTDTVTEDIVITVNDDTTAPSAPTIEGITAGSYNKDQSFTISGEDKATIEYSLDGGSSWSEYNSEVTLSEEGSYEITARQTDEAGNISDNSDTIVVEIDKTAPSAPTIEGITEGSYNKDQSFTISGEGKATIEYTLDGGSGWGKYNSEVTLSDEGSYEITARQTDEAGNISSTTDAITVTIDKTAPTWSTDPYITTPADTSSVGISAEIDETGTIYYKIMSDGATKPTASEIKSAENSISMSAEIEEEITIDSLNEGTEYDIFFVAEDDKENLQSNDAVKKVDANTEVANQEPVIIGINPVIDGAASVTEGEELSLIVMASDEDGDNLNFDISGTDADKFSQSDTAFTWTPPYDDYSSNNTFNITIEVSDGTDTVTEDIVITVNDDTTAPSAPTIEGITAGSYNTDQSFTISGEDKATIEYSLNGGSSWSEYNSEVTLSTKGSYEITARQTDEAGNTSNTTDAITVTIVPSPPTINGISSGEYNTDQSFTISGEDGAVIEYSTDGGSSWSEYNSEVTLSTEGSYEITARQTDEAGNTSNNTDAITVTIDKTAPTWSTDPSITTSADTSSVGISAEIDETGTIYYKVMSDGAAEATSSEVKSAGNSISMSADSTKEITIDSLNAGTEYDIFFIAEDDKENLQSNDAVKKVDVSTLSEPYNSSFVNVLAGTTSYDNEEVTLEYHIEMSKYEVTHAEFIEFLNSAGVSSEGSYEGKEVINMDDTSCAVDHDGSSFNFAGSNDAESEETPVMTVTWYGALAYCNWLSEQEGLTPAYDLNNWALKNSDQSALEGYRLPTSKEWEYAALGGANGNYTAYAGSDYIDDVAWYSNTSDSKTHPVGEKEANELGIYDMTGNVWEWTYTEEWNGTIYVRVYRGGGWSSDAAGNLRVIESSLTTSPSSGYNTIGFRLIKTK